MLNKVMLIGHLGRDPEVRHLESGAVVAKFSIATSERYKDKAGETQTQTEWHDIVMWRKSAELAERLLSKGKLIYVEGKLTHRKWQDKDGNDRYTTEVLANNFQILEKKDSNSGGYGNNFPSADQAPKQISGTEGITADQTLTTPTAKPADTQSPPAEDDLPF